MHEAVGRRHTDMIEGELPRFVELLRLSSGPIEEGFEHCGQRPEVDELEDLDTLVADTSRMRAIFQCRCCEAFFWGWWD